MKYLYWTVGAIVLIAAAIFGLQIVASERVEVVELRTVDPAGEAITTRLWVVDDAGIAYLRSTDSGSGWGARALANPQVQLTRNDQVASYRVQARQDKRDRINRLMREKYTWGDSVIAVLVGGRESSVPLELRRLD